MRAICQRTLNPRPRRFTGRAPVRLLLGREAFDGLGQQPFSIAATLHSQRGGVAVSDPAALRVKDQNAIGTGFKESSKLLLALAQCRFRAFALGNIARYGHVQSPAADADLGHKHFQRDFVSIEAAAHPFEAVTAALFNQGCDLSGLFARRSAVGLKLRREILRPRSQELFLCAGAHQFDRRRIAIHEHSGLRIEQPDRVNAPLEKALEHGASLPCEATGGTSTFVPFAGCDSRMIHRVM